MYKLTKQNIRYGVGGYGAPVLIRDTDSGPYDRNSILPFTANSTAFAFVDRHYRGKTLASDPGLTVDQGADFKEYCSEYLTARRSIPQPR